MRAQAQRGSHHNLIENGSRSIDDELAATSRAHDASQISRIHLGDGNRASFAQKAPRTIGVTVPAPDSMSLTLQQFREEGAGRSGT